MTGPRRPRSVGWKLTALVTLALLVLSFSIIPASALYLTGGTTAASGKSSQASVAGEQVTSSSEAAPSGASLNGGGSATTVSYWSDEGSYLNTYLRSSVVGSDGSIYQVGGIFTSSPYDPHLPESSPSSEKDSASPSVSISTLAPEDIVLGFLAAAGDPGTVTAGSGFKLIEAPQNTPVAAVEYAIVDSYQSSLSVGFSLGSATEWQMVGDAIEAAPFGILGIDGVASNNRCGGAGSCTATLTTSDSKDVIIALCADGGTGDGQPSVSGAGLTWYMRSTPTLLASTPWISEWYAIAASPLNDGQITCTGGTTGNVDIQVFGISGADTNENTIAGSEAFVLKYSSTGTLQWSQVWSLTSCSEQFAVAASVQGNYLYVTGDVAIATPCPKSTTVSDDIFLLKLSTSTGDVASGGEEVFSGNGNDSVSSVAVSPNGDWVFLGGATECCSTMSSAAQGTPIVIGVNSAFSAYWAQDFQGEGHGAITGVVASPNSNSVAASGMGDSAFVLNYTSSGTMQWSEAIAELSGSTEALTGIAIGPSSGTGTHFLYLIGSESDCTTAVDFGEIALIIDIPIIIFDVATFDWEFLGLSITFEVLNTLWSQPPQPACFTGTFVGALPAPIASDAAPWGPGIAGWRDDVNSSSQSYYPLSIAVDPAGDNIYLAGFVGFTSDSGGAYIFDVATASNTAKEGTLLAASYLGLADANTPELANLDSVTVSGTGAVTLSGSTTSSTNQLTFSAGLQNSTFSLWAATVFWGGTSEPVSLTATSYSSQTASPTSSSDTYVSNAWNSFLLLTSAPADAAVTFVLTPGGVGDMLEEDITPSCGGLQQAAQTLVSGDTYDFFAGSTVPVISACAYHPAEEAFSGWSSSSSSVVLGSTVSWSTSLEVNGPGTITAAFGASVGLTVNMGYGCYSLNPNPTNVTGTFLCGGGTYYFHLDTPVTYCSVNSAYNSGPDSGLITNAPYSILELGGNSIPSPTPTTNATPTEYPTCMTFTPSQSVTVASPAVDPVPITFSEDGLPTGADWGVSLVGYLIYYPSANPSPVWQAQEYSPTTSAGSSITINGFGENNGLSSGTEYPFSYTVNTVSYDGCTYTPTSSTGEFFLNAAFSTAISYTGDCGSSGGGGGCYAPPAPAFMYVDMMPELFGAITGCMPACEC